MTIDEARAHQQYDDCMFCPGCSKLLTGLHMGSMCYINWIERKAQKFEEETCPEGLVIIMAILIIVGILGICFVDGIKKHKKYVRNKYNKEG